MYQIEFRPAARRQFDALSRKIQEAIQPAIDALTETPRPDGVKKLKGWNNLYRIKVGPENLIVSSMKFAMKL